MAKTDFTWVGTPHDPKSISGSDPFNPVGSANLAVWYNCDRGNIVAPGWTNNAHTNTDYTTKVLTVKDISGNSRAITGDQRHLGHPDTKYPSLTGSRNANGTENNITRNLMTSITGDNHRFLVSSQNIDGGRSWGIGTNKRNQSRTSTSYDHRTTPPDSAGWVTGSSDVTRAKDNTQQLSGSYTVFSTARSAATTTDHESGYFLAAAYPYSWGYANTFNGKLAGQGQGQFRLGFRHGDADASGDNKLGQVEVFWRDNITTDTSDNTHVNNFWTRHAGLRSDSNYSTTMFHPISCRYDAPKALASPARRALANDTDWYIDLHCNGEKINFSTGDINTGDFPRNNSAQYHGFGIGAAIAADGSYNTGGGNNTVTDVMDPNTALTDRHSPAWTEACAYDDCLSDIRYQQIQRYFADRLQRPMSGSSGTSTLEFLSTFTGGPEGTAVVGSGLGNPLSNAEGGTYQREYVQAVTSSDSTLIQHETAAGAFVKSTKGITGRASSGAWDNSPFYAVTSSTAISMRMWVRMDNVDDDYSTVDGDNIPRYDGSQIALVAKATSPFGHKLDHIKGYALKFGTFKDGLQASGGSTHVVPKIRLSLRNSDQHLDGSTFEGCGDIDLTHGSVTPAQDNWFRLRLDVIPSGQAFDIIKAYAANRGDHNTWIQLGDASNNTSWKIYNSDPNYRYWSDDTSFKRRVQSPNGIHNGYWIAMSSSDGRSLENSKHYVEGFTILTDDV